MRIRAPECKRAGRDRAGPIRAWVPAFAGMSGVGLGANPLSAHPGARGGPAAGFPPGQAIAIVRGIGCASIGASRPSRATASAAFGGGVPAAA